MQEKEGLDGIHVVMNLNNITHSLAKLFIKLNPLTLSNEESIIGLAAGFDTDNDVAKHLHRLGFGFAEVGSFTPYPRSGKPNTIIKESDSIWNQCSLPNKGAIYGKNRARGVTYKIPTLANIAPVENTRLIDMVMGVNALKKTYTGVVVNMSCPSVEYPELMWEFLNERNDVYIKIAPNMPLQYYRDIAEIDAEGYVCTNALLTPMGGLSGNKLKEYSNETIRTMRKLTSKPIIGCGGVATPKDVYEKVSLGADLVEIYTGWIYSMNPYLPYYLMKGFNELLHENGYKLLTELKNTEI